MGEITGVVVEVLAVVFGIVLCLFFDLLYIRRKKAGVWGEAVGIAFCYLFGLSLMIIMINSNALLSNLDLRVVFHGMTALTMGGLAYTA